MTAQIELNWNYRSTNDSEFADAEHGSFALQIQDCDGDLSRWHIKRGGHYIAVGEEHSVKSSQGDTVYHMDHAMAKAVMVLGYLLKGDHLNEFCGSFPGEEDDGVDPTASDLLKPRGNGGVVSPEICFTALLLMGDADVTEAEISGWTIEQQNRAYDWAMRVHLHASDNEDVFVPERPHFVKRFERRVG